MYYQYIHIIALEKRREEVKNTVKLISNVKQLLQHICVKTQHKPKEYKYQETDVKRDESRCWCINGSPIILLNVY